MSLPASPAQVSASLQRRTDERAAQDWARAARSDPATCVLVARGTTHLVRHEPETQIVFLPPDQPPISVLEDSRLLLLGWFAGRRCLLADLPPELPFELAGARFEELRPLLPLLREQDARLLSYARALLNWRARHHYC